MSVKGTDHPQNEIYVIFYLPSYFLKSITGNFQKHFLYNLFLCVYIG